MPYLDNAATSFPKPPPVYEALHSALERYGGSPGRGAYPMARDAAALVHDTRQLLAELFHAADPQRIIFTLNATDALNMAIKGSLSPGDHVVTTVYEHHSVARPLARLEQGGLIQVTRVSGSPEGLIHPAAIARAITRRTKLVAVIHGSNVTGALQPIDAIGPIVREHGALFLVDASQTAGAVPIDVEASGIDLLAFPGHKALLGPPGTGGLYVGPRARLSPWREGGTGVLSEMPLQPEELPYALEAGSPNTIGLAGLREAVLFLLSYGVERIHAHKQALTRRLMDGIRSQRLFTLYGPHTVADRIAVVSVASERSAPDVIARHLDDVHGIAVRSGLHCAPGAHRALGTYPQGTLRISPGCFTTPEDIDQCLEAMRDVVAEGAAA